MQKIKFMLFEFFQLTKIKFIPFQFFGLQKLNSSVLSFFKLTKTYSDFFKIGTGRPFRGPRLAARFQILKKFEFWCFIKIKSLCSCITHKTPHLDRPQVPDHFQGDFNRENFFYSRNVTRGVLYLQSFVKNFDC